EPPPWPTHPGATQPMRHRQAMPLRGNARYLNVFAESPGPLVQLPRIPAIFPSPRREYLRFEVAPRLPDFHFRTIFGESPKLLEPAVLPAWVFHRAGKRPPDGLAK